MCQSKLLVYFLPFILEREQIFATRNLEALVCPSNSMELAGRHLCFSSSQWFQSMPAFSTIPEGSGTGGAQVGRHFRWLSGIQEWRVLCLSPARRQKSKTIHPEVVSWDKRLSYITDKSAVLFLYYRQVHRCLPTSQTRVQFSVAFNLKQQLDCLTSLLPLLWFQHTLPACLFLLGMFVSLRSGTLTSKSLVCVCVCCVRTCLGCPCQCVHVSRTEIAVTWLPLSLYCLLFWDSLSPASKLTVLESKSLESTLPHP